jgi:hypothetical protein
MAMIKIMMIMIFDLQLLLMCEIRSLWPSRPYIPVLFSEELLCVSRRLRWGCKGSDSFHYHQNFFKVFFILITTFLISYLLEESIIISWQSTLSCTKNGAFFRADGKDSIFIIRSKNYFNLIA